MSACVAYHTYCPEDAPCQSKPSPPGRVEIQVKYDGVVVLATSWAWAAFLLENEPGSVLRITVTPAP